MDRVIPKEIVDLIYKESHLDKTKRLNTEYYQLFFIEKSYGKTGNIILYYKYIEGQHTYLNDRDLCFSHVTILNFKKRKVVGILPKRYHYSSGHYQLKWIE